MPKKIILFLLVFFGLVGITYLFQPIKKGKGLDSKTIYELVENWPDLPADSTLGNPTGLCLDTSQHLVVFHRADRSWPLVGSMPSQPIKSNTILIIDRNSGRLLESWGGNLFVMPHGLKVDRENNIWVTDVGLHQVFKFSHKGDLLMKRGEAGVPGSDSAHFNRPTDIAINPDGSFFVSDGYANSRVIKFSAKGEFLFEWGTKGNKPSEFNIPHGLTLDHVGNLYVADRENNRIQVFDTNGKFIKQFSDDSFGAICAVSFDSSGSRLFAVDDYSYLKLKHRGSDIFIFDSAGLVQSRFGRSGGYKGEAAWYHSIAVSKEGDIFVGDIEGNTIQKFRAIRR